MTRKQRTKSVPRSFARAYAREAREVLEGAEKAHEDGNMRVAALAVVNACIRASDALCIATLGEYSAGDDHTQAVLLLKRIPEGPNLAEKLKLALAYKTEWSYGVEVPRSSELKKIFRVAHALVAEAERRAIG